MYTHTVPTYACMYVVCMYVRSRDETILQYIDILQYFLLQYNTIRLKNIDILYVAIYCDILQCLLFLKLYIFNHYTAKMTGPLVTWNIQSSFLLF